MDRTEQRPYRAYVEKQILPVVVCTGTQRIEGHMHITYHHRALDILNGLEEFIPITSARVFNAATDTLIAEREFVAVNKHTITTLWETGEPFSPPTRPVARASKALDEPFPSETNSPEPSESV